MTVRRAITVTLILLLVHPLGCRLVSFDDASPDRPQESVVPSSPKVVVFMIDGPRYSETFGDPTHVHVPGVWNTLRPLGTLYTNFRNRGITATVPGHASVLTGTWQSISNDGLQRPTLPTVFEYYRQQTGADSSDVWLVAGKNKLAACSYSTHASYGSAYGAIDDVGHATDVSTYERLHQVLQTQQPTLVMASFSQVDQKGHSGVWEDYVRQIEVVDSLVCVTWDALQADPFYAGQTYLFITADHGRHDDANGGFQHHGDGCDGCQRLIFLVLGPDIRQDFTFGVPYAYTQRDLGATIAYILGIDTPLADGLVMHEMFAPTVTGIRSPR